VKLLRTLEWPDRCFVREDPEALAAACCIARILRDTDLQFSASCAMTQRSDRVRAHSSPAVNERIDRESLARVRRYAQRERGDVARRIRALEREWDIERLLELNAALFSLAGLVLGVTRDRRWFALPGVVASFLALHAIQGWCPPVVVMRHLGRRTRHEIDREKYALKAMRGDFEGAAGRSQASWRAVRS
jgi:hypothetical protein